MRERQLGKVGRLRREIVGKACPICGGRTYHLLFRSGAVSLAGISAECAHCHESRKLGDDLGRILWV